ncbi:uncharacterized protein PG998_006787 [Apiospora kogelbergensis]|uniref:uncharacterized protein n=1 Tax=Apiospora kogelbergensis TaxID=1337665 RepID=UPI00312DDF9B
MCPSSTDNVPVQPSTPNSKAVTPLHAYDCIIATQHPDLHLTLTGNSVYLKPIPVYMLCVDFWRWLAVAPNDKNQATYKAAMGFMRTYCLLIRYASDFRKAALIHELIPRDLKVKITYESFVGFISQFANVPDSDVAPRYTHGELALRSFVSPHRLFLEAPEEDETEDGDNEKERTENQPASASSYKSWSVSSGPVTTAKADDPSTLAPSLFELSSMLFLLFFGGHADMVLDGRFGDGEMARYRTSRPGLCVGHVDSDSGDWHLCRGVLGCKEEEDKENVAGRRRLGKGWNCRKMTATWFN